MTTLVFFRSFLLMLYLPLVWLIAQAVLMFVPPGRARRILTTKLW